METRHIAIIGLGYVGLPVAAAFAKRSRVIGFDKDPQRISELQRGQDRSGELSNTDLRTLDWLLTTHEEDMSEADFYIITVSTPVDENKNPDLRPLLKASSSVGNQLKVGDIVVYESTVYPGATEEMCIPVLERQSGLRCGIDFSVGYSPERINPGDTQHAFHNTLKIVSAGDQKTLEIVAHVYESVVEAGVYRASSIQVAEAAKVIENTQRDICIATINELAMIFDRLGLDTHDVLEAASTKWNFLKFTPGLVGGHCIGIDPYYLINKAQQVGYDAQVISAARHVNDGMGEFIARRVIDSLITAGFLLSESSVTILGLAFKENVSDLRNTRIGDIVHFLQNQDIRVQVHDPLVDKDQAQTELAIGLRPIDKLRPAQCVVLAVAHRQYTEKGWTFIRSLLDRRGGVVIDVKGVLARDQVPDDVLLWRL